MALNMALLVLAMPALRQASARVVVVAVSGQDWDADGAVVPGKVSVEAAQVEAVDAEWDAEAEVAAAVPDKVKPKVLYCKRNNLV